MSGRYSDLKEEGMTRLRLASLNNGEISAIMHREKPELATELNQKEGGGVRKKNGHPPLERLAQVWEESESAKAWR